MHATRIGGGDCAIRFLPVSPYRFRTVSSSSSLSRGSLSLCWGFAHRVANESGHDVPALLFLLYPPCALTLVLLIFITKSILLLSSTATFLSILFLILSILWTFLNTGFTLYRPSHSTTHSFFTSNFLISLACIKVPSTCATLYYRHSTTRILHSDRFFRHLFLESHPPHTTSTLSIVDALLILSSRVRGVLGTIIRYAT